MPPPPKIKINMNLIVYMKNVQLLVPCICCIYCIRICSRVKVRIRVKNHVLGFYVKPQQCNRRNSAPTSCHESSNHVFLLVLRLLNHETVCYAVHSVRSILTYTWNTEQNIRRILDKNIILYIDTSLFFVLFFLKNVHIN